MLILFISVIVFVLMLNKEVQETRSLFSWNSEEVKSGSSELFKTMNNLNINTLYQEFSNDFKQEEIKDFLKEANKKGIEVYLLTGNPKWALDETGKPMISIVERVIKINENLNKNLKIKAIVFDIEPYQLEEWNNKSKEKIMDSFLEGMKNAYMIANDNNIKIILCIPYFYDNMGLTKQLESLIESGSDSVAVMNYFKDKEAENIIQEVEFTEKYGKKLINVYELQEPGNYGLTEKNTYYNEGVLEIEKNFDNIKREFEGKDISIAFHEYNSLREVLGNE